MVYIVTRDSKDKDFRTNIHKKTGQRVCADPLKQSICLLSDYHLSSEETVSFLRA